jgi:ribosomal protein S4
MKAVDLIISKGAALSKGEARRLIVQGHLKVNGETIISQEYTQVYDLEVQVKPGDTIQIGKREFTHE